MTTFSTATEKHPIKSVEITLKNAKMMSIFQRIALQDFRTLHTNRIRYLTPA
jgi:hypothetical protein